jgi:hypothetical protein
MTGDCATSPLITNRLITGRTEAVFVAAVSVTTITCIARSVPVLITGLEEPRRPGAGLRARSPIREQ